MAVTIEDLGLDIWMTIISFYPFRRRNWLNFMLVNRRFHQIGLKFFDPKANMHALIVACKNGQMSLVEHLLQDGFDPSAMNFLAVSMAVKKGHVAVVHRLLQDHRVATTAGFQKTFNTACELGQLEIVNELLKYNEVTDNIRRAGLRCACWKGQTNIIDRLLQDKEQKLDWDLFKIVCNGGNGDKFSPKTKRLRERYPNAIARLMSDERIDPSVSNSEALMLACRRGDLTVVNMLLNDPRVDPSASSNNAIQEACDSGHLDIVNRLLQDPRVYVPDYALIYACQNGHVKVVDRLLEDGRVQGIQKAFECACKNGQLAVVERLLQDERIDPSIGDAVKLATDSGNMDVVARLYKDPRVRPPDDVTAILLALRQRDMNLVETLMKTVSINLYSMSKNRSK